MNMTVNNQESSMSELEQMTKVRPPSQKWLAATVIYSLFYFLPVSFMTFTTLQWILKLSIYAVFLFVYYLIFRVYHEAFKRSYYTTTLIVSMVLVAVSASFLTPGSNSLFGYPVFFAMALLPIRSAIAVVVAIFLAIFSLAYYLFDFSIGFIAPALAITVSLIFYGLFERNRLKFESAKQEAKAEIEQLAIIAERERIARDLHDVLGHSLSSIALKSQLARKLAIAGNVDEAAFEIQQVADIASHALTEVREAVSGYKHSGIREHIERCISLLKQSNFTVSGEQEILELPPRVESTLILIMKELVTNILRHSHGDGVEFSLSKANQSVVLSMQDNGIHQGKKIPFGNGLTGMRDRVHHMGGTFDLSLDKGFMVCVTLGLRHD